MEISFKSAKQCTSLKANLIQEMDGRLFGSVLNISKSTGKNVSENLEKNEITFGCCCDVGRIDPSHVFDPHGDFWRGKSHFLQKNIIGISFAKNWKKIQQFPHALHIVLRFCDKLCPCEQLICEEKNTPNIRCC